MALASLIVAVGAMAAAAAAAIYTRSQVAELRRQFKQAGPVLTVGSGFGYPINMGTDRLQISVTVTNSGRGEATITGWGFRVLSDGYETGIILGTTVQGSFGPSMTHRLVGMDSASWFMDRQNLRLALAGHDAPSIIPFVDVGDGSRVSGKVVTLRD